jgi:hypothetical protein
MSFWKDHFDHILLSILGVVGAAAGIWCAAKNLPKPSEWCFVEAAAAVSALFMRMTGPRAPQPPAVPNVPGLESPKV